MSQHPHRAHRIVPAMGLHALTPFYDAALRLSMRERAFRDRVLDVAEIAAGMRVLDVGCGTGTLLLRAHEREPSAALTGIDADPAILRIAGDKARRAGAAISFETASAATLPCADASFDRVLSTLALHHLSAEDQRAALVEMHRVLRPGGRVVIGDFGPHGHAGGLHERVFRWLSGDGGRSRGSTGARAESVSGLAHRVQEAGFERVRRAADLRTIFGTIEIVVGER